MSISREALLSSSAKKALIARLIPGGQHMCNVCGCGSGETRIHGQTHSKSPGTAHHRHLHSHHHHNPADKSIPEHDHRDLYFGSGTAGVHVAGYTQTEIVQIERNILSRNDGYAEHNKRLLDDLGVLALNLVSSPGSGKTTLLTSTIKALIRELPVAVIEGDQETANDADRIRETGAAAVQINTGRGCHLDAHMVGHAFENLPLESGGVLFVENVGNLVCPASFNLGEDHKVTILSVTEGEDKPLKYPDMFAVSDLVILSKIDLLPHLEFDIERCIDYAKRVNPEIEVIKLSAMSGEGLTDWLDWIKRRRNFKITDNAASSREPVTSRLPLNL